mgnify:CR=1 FL=1
MCAAALSVARLLFAFRGSLLTPPSRGPAPASRVGPLMSNVMRLAKSMFISSLGPCHAVAKLGHWPPGSGMSCHVLRASQRLTAARVAAGRWLGPKSAALAAHAPLCVAARGRPYGPAGRLAFKLLSLPAPAVPSALGLRITPQSSGPAPARRVSPLT